MSDLLPPAARGILHSPKGDFPFETLCIDVPLGRGAQSAPVREEIFPERSRSSVRFDTFVAFSTTGTCQVLRCKAVVSPVHPRQAMRPWFPESQPDSTWFLQSLAMFIPDSRSQNDTYLLCELVRGCDPTPRSHKMQRSIRSSFTVRSLQSSVFSPAKQVVVHR